MPRPGSCSLSASMSVPLVQVLPEISLYPIEPSHLIFILTAIWAWESCQSHQSWPATPAVELAPVYQTCSAALATHNIDRDSLCSQHSSQILAHGAERALGRGVVAAVDAAAVARNAAH